MAVLNPFDHVDVVVFDLDGTLIDSAGDIAHSINWVLSRRGLPPLRLERVRRLIGRPPGEIFSAAGFTSRGETARAVSEFREHLFVHVGERSAVYSGVPETLSRLKRRGIGTALATTKPTGLAKRAVAAAGLDSLFDHVQGTDGFPPKPDPGVVLRALSIFGHPRGVMVGDTPDDVLAGKAAGLRTVGVLHGSRSDAEIRACGPDLVVGRIGLLLSFLT